MIKILNKKCFEKMNKKYILTHTGIKLVRLQFDAWSRAYITFMHKFAQAFSISKQNKVRVFWSVISLSTTIHNRKKTATNPDGSNEIVSMSIHSRNDETFPNCRKRKLSLFISVCFFKENICKYQYDNWCSLSQLTTSLPPPPPQESWILNILV